MEFVAVNVSDGMAVTRGKDPEEYGYEQLVEARYHHDAMCSRCI